ncbi:MAG: putative viral replication protein [Cressdnaviricota sp.]|nr:MAG: putative viral replication protein [Cressdnaviricota sp.]
MVVVTRSSKRSGEICNNIKISPKVVKIEVNGKKKQISPAKHWCFTINNHNKKHISLLMSVSSIDQLVMQEETGDNGTHHLQGYLKFKWKKRPQSEFGKDFGAHWSKTRNIRQSIAYCQKEDTRTGKIWFRKLKRIRPLKCISLLYPWQKKLVDIVSEEPCDRTIYWYFSKLGDVGKSAIARYLCIHHGALIVSGKLADIKFQIINSVDVVDLVIWDVPRTAENYINYGGLEKVKDACFASNKYESKMYIGNPPHVIVFANFEPDREKLSKDRWKIRELIKHDVGVISEYNM